MDDARVVALVEAFERSIEEGHQALIADPAALHARTSIGETALHLLCFGNSVKLIRELIRCGAAVDNVSDAATTPLSDSASLGYAELVMVLLEAGASVWLEGQHDPTLHQAVRSANEVIVRLILDAGADVNEQDSLRETALHVAVDEDKAEIARLLLARGADPGLKNLFDRTALGVAQEAGSLHCIALLTTRQ